MFENLQTRGRARALNGFIFIHAINPCSSQRTPAQHIGERIVYSSVLCVQTPGSASGTGSIAGPLLSASPAGRCVSEVRRSVFHYAPLSLRSKPSTTGAPRNPPPAACTSSGSPNRNCHPTRPPCSSRSPPSSSPSWRATLWRTWWAWSPPKPPMCTCGLKSQVRPLRTCGELLQISTLPGCYEKRRDASHTPVSQNLVKKVFKIIFR